ncbi:winged helix-turn-helix domain-containing protein [Serratia fonticola]|uniref:winged helix-turn-helix domain-containing protein n=1 Tax=Serratia fonticola TaxID=47917 RepID=UPI00192B4416|nr:helix-turn-helix domain-containing protein [Serratia fonticola]MBL5906304.1 helix-turn-helix domain-containing protein [Serratia fonticola]
MKNDTLLSIELTKPAGRLLCELIENNRNTLSKDVIIQNVWVNYGFAASKANLSNHISELRKAFVNLGLDSDVIITVPKVGFRMEAEIHPVVKAEKILKEVTIEERRTVIVDEPTTFINERTLSQPESRTEKSRKTVKLNIIIIVITLLLASAAGVAFILLPKRDVVPLVTTIGQCNIYSLNSVESPADFIKTATTQMESEKIDCTQESIDIYYADYRRNNSQLKISFMSVCKNRDGTHYKNCTNYKYIK